MPGARRSMASRVRVAAIRSWSYVTSSGPKQRGQTYDSPMGWVSPQWRQASPVTRAVDAPAAQLAEVDQTFEPVADVHEGAEVDDRGHLALDRFTPVLALAQALERLAPLLLEDLAARHHDALATLAHLEHPKVELLVDVGGGALGVLELDL